MRYTSFAWNNEFLAFSKAAQQDKLSREVRLLNGNVASRILPVRIHELEKDDVQLFENVLSGVLRSIDFIYQAQGVNRPLRPKDDDYQDNVNNTIYRNQINKVANAIKEILQGVKAKAQDSRNQVPDRPEYQTPPPTQLASLVQYNHPQRNTGGGIRHPTAHRFSGVDFQ